MLKPWMDQFSVILNHPVQPEDPDDWSIRMEVRIVVLIKIFKTHRLFVIRIIIELEVSYLYLSPGFKVLESVCSEFPQPCRK